MDRYYMVDGELIKYTPEELKALEDASRTETPPQPNIDERVTALEQNMADIQAGYMEGVNHA